MIRQCGAQGGGQVFSLETNATQYLFQVLPSGHLEHLYFGEKMGDPGKLSDQELAEDAQALSEKRAFAAGNTVCYDETNPALTLEDLRLEMSADGKGDIREPFVEVTHADGSRTSDFLFADAYITQGKPPFETLPGSYAENDADIDQLTVILKDRHYNLTLELHYYVFARADVISRSAKLVNDSEETVRISRLMSMQLDLDGSGYVVSSFTGAWIREMERRDVKLNAGRFVNASHTGTSSNHANPFVMLSGEHTTEDSGCCYGFNLIYSGNHYEAAEVSAFDKTRFVSGISPRGFSWQLESGESFEAPEAVMTFSAHGFNELSQHMHGFVREHIVRGVWKHKKRPVLLNSWEAAYFKIDEQKLLNLAKKGKEVGMELFVMDDGWFGRRDDDASSLGDWDVNLKKIPGGLKGLSEKIHALGMDFGIWIEPEMISENSDLFRGHPDWAMRIPGRPHSMGRHQMLLDLANPAVTDYMSSKIVEVLGSADINYVKWDMNRIMSDVYSPYLPADRQGETAHRYVLGLYRMMHAITQTFPDILFEGCAAGGGRFDLGVLCHMPQIWASDDTDARQRVKIQEGYSYGYPMSVLTSHVSVTPNHQTLRSIPMDSRFHVNAFGLLGYELNLCDLSREELAEIREQIRIYKKWRGVLQGGHFYRGRHDNIHEWTCVSSDKSRAVGMLYQEMSEPNRQTEVYQAAGLQDNKRYHLYNTKRVHDIRKFGDLVNTASPVHVKQGSLLHNTMAKFITMPGEEEDVHASGALLMRAGVKLTQAYSATGFNENTRYFADDSSRLYFMEEEG